MIRYGTVIIAGVTFYVLPDGYRLMSRGNSSQIIQTSTGPVFDPGYGQLGFSISGWIGDDSGLSALEEAARSALDNGQPLTASDNIGPIASWTGFVQVPVFGVGKVSNNMFGTPSVIYPSPGELTFWSSESRIIL